MTNSCLYLLQFCTNSNPEDNWLLAEATEIQNENITKQNKTNT